MLLRNIGFKTGRAPNLAYFADGLLFLVNLGRKINPTFGQGEFMSVLADLRGGVAVGNDDLADGAPGDESGESWPRAASIAISPDRRMSR